MTTRTRKATQAKPATKTAAAPARRPARKTAAKKQAAAPAPSTAIVLAKPATDDRTTIVDTRPPLTVRRRSAADPYTPEQLTEARACLASATARLPIFVLSWKVPAQTRSRRAAAHLADGTVITHVADRNPIFAVDIPCRTGARHQHTITTAAELDKVRQAAAACTIQHGTDDQHEAITDGVPAQAPTVPVPNPAVRNLGDALHRAKSATTDTQPMSRSDIDAVIAAGNPDPDTAREHPDHD